MSFAEQHGYERKHAIKLLGNALPEAKGGVRCGPEPVYEPVREVVERIWQASEQLCGKRLAPALELWLPHYAKHFGGLLPTQKKLLKKVSAATLDRAARSDQSPGAPTPVRHATGHAPAHADSHLRRSLGRTAGRLSGS
jgi:hypothetical protein